jgi:hypothetical protein
MTALQGKELPLEHLTEYTAAAEYYAIHNKLPECMGVPGAIEYIEDDPDSFIQEVRNCQYANAMNKIGSEV